MTLIAAAAASVDNAPGGRRWGRYAVYGEIASGGMATIEYGRLIGPRGFARPVAIKRLHPHFAKDPEFVTMFVDEARMSSRLHHANVVATLDVIEGPGELALVMEYVHGESLATLFELARERGEVLPVRIAATLLAGVLHGLQAAHDATNEQGEPLRIVHRDVSPQNVLVGRDGVPRVLDFGVAKAIGRLRTTPSGEIKGKLAYIAPEQLCGGEVDRRADVYGASAVMWEALTGRQLFDGPNESVIVHAVLNQVVAAPSTENPDVPAALDRIVLRGLSRPVEERFANAREMATALEREVGMVAQSEVSDWLQRLAGAQLQARARRLQQMQEESERASEQGSQGQGGQGTRKIPVAADGMAEAGTDAPDAALAGARKRRGRAYGPWLALGASLLLAASWAFARSGGGARDRASSPAAATRPIAAPVAEPIEPEAEAVLEAPAAPPLAAVAEVAPAEPEPETAGTDPGVERAGERTPASTAARRARAAQARDRKLARAATGAPAAGAADVKASSGIAPARDCVPPYVIDRDGVRHPKLECL